MQIINSLTKVLLLENSHNYGRSIESFLRVITEDRCKIYVYSVSLLDRYGNFLQRNAIELIIVNLRIDKINLLNIQRQIYSLAPKIPVIFIAADSTEQKLIQQQRFSLPSEDIGTQKYLVKHKLSAQILNNTISSALTEETTLERLQHLQKANIKLKSQLKYTQELFKTVVDTTSTLMWMIDEREQYTFVNQAWLSFTGQTLDEALIESWRDRIHPLDLASCNRAYQNALKKCQGFQIEYRLKRFDNTYRTILNTAVRRYNDNGDFAGLLCSCLDITQRKKIEQKVIRQAQTDRILADITQNIHSSLELDIILQIAAEQVIDYLSIDKISIDKIVDRYRLYLLFEATKNNFSSSCKLSKKQDRYERVLVNCRKKLSQGEIVSSGNMSLSKLTSNNSELINISYPLLSIPIIVSNKLWGLIFVEQNLPPRCWLTDEIKFLERVTIQLGIAIKQSELYQDLEELSIIDGLTKIANRRKFDRYLVTEWRRLTREKSPLSLILCDVDHFKLYNDTYGHQAGDRCLQQVAEAIRAVIKRPADLAARYGGEEFVIVLPNTNTEGAKYLAQQIRLQIESLKIPHINSPVDLYITLSFGVSSCIPQKNLDCSVLVEAADRNLYKAKELGRNQIVESTTV